MNDPEAINDSPNPMSTSGDTMIASDTTETPLATSAGPTLPPYPGVYVQQFVDPSTSIVGAPTSITAFVGRALRGPVDQAVTILSFADFRATFGGLWSASPMSYQVYQFFLNGGASAVVVRAKNATGVPLTSASLQAPGPSGALTLAASSEGAWGNNVTATIDPDPGAAGTFNLTLRELDPSDGMKVLSEESFTGLSVEPTASTYIVHVLDQRSVLARVAGTVPSMPPGTMAATPFAGGSDGDPLKPSDLIGEQASKTGMYALDSLEIFNILSLPPLLDAAGAIVDIDIAAWREAQIYCDQRRAILLIDPPASWKSVDDAAGFPALGLGDENSAFYWPWLVGSDPLNGNQPIPLAPCGTVAGIIASFDARVGVWAAPAGIQAAMTGIRWPAVQVTDTDIARVAPLGVNVIRSLPSYGIVIWGARTTLGLAHASSDMTFLSVQRLALYIADSLTAGLQWAVFQSNDSSLWGVIRQQCSTFMNQLYLEGGLQGSSAADAYFVTCDASTTTQTDIDNGIVNVLVGFAPMRPAEFTVLTLQVAAESAS